MSFRSGKISFSLYSFVGDRNLFNFNKIIVLGNKQRMYFVNPTNLKNSTAEQEEASFEPNLSIQLIDGVFATIKHEFRKIDRVELKARIVKKLSSLVSKPSRSEKKQIKDAVYDSLLNETPVSYRTFDVLIDFTNKLIFFSGTPKIMDQAWGLFKDVTPSLLSIGTLADPDSKLTETDIFAKLCEKLETRKLMKLKDGLDDHILRSYDRHTIPKFDYVSSCHLSFTNTDPVETCSREFTYSIDRAMFLGVSMPKAIDKKAPLFEKLDYRLDALREMVLAWKKIVSDVSKVTDQ